MATAEARLHSAQRVYIHTVVAISDGVKAAKENCALCAVRCSMLRALKEGGGAIKLAETLKNEELALEAEAEELVAGARICRGQLAKMHRALGAMEFIVEQHTLFADKQQREELRDILVEAEAGVLRSPRNHQWKRKLETATKAIVDIERRKEIAILVSCTTNHA